MDQAHDLGVKPLYGFGMYFDNPQNVPERELRSEAGIIIEEADVPQFREQDGRTRVIPRGKFMKAEFPLKSWLSIFIGIWRVYPAIMDEMSRRGLSPRESFELYDFSGKRTIYLFPIRAS